MCFDPSTGCLIDTIPNPTPKDVKDLYERTAAAQVKWAKSTFEQRRAVLRSLLAFVLENQEAICQADCRDTGKTSKSGCIGHRMESSY